MEQTGELIIACLLFPQATPGILRVAEACYRFTPLIALRSEEAIFLDLSRIPGFQIPRFSLKAAALVKRFELSARIAFASDPGAALALARSGAQALKFVPLEFLPDYAEPFFADAEFDERVQKKILTFKRLGLRTLDDFSKLPPRTLASRFGKEGVELSLRINRRLTAPWPGFRLPERLIERIDLRNAEDLAACETLESLLFSVRTLLNRIMARLRGRVLRAASFRLSFKLEKTSALRGDPVRSWTFVLPVPQGSVTGVLPIVRDRLHAELSRHPLSSPVTELALEVLETAPGHGAQSDFFNRHAEQSERWDQLLGRLAEKLGKDRAFLAAPVARHLPEKAWRAVTGQAASKSIEPGPFFPLPPRPSRLLPTPEPVSRNGLREWLGPERVSGEWWMDEGFKGFHRDYYQVTTASGERLWIFERDGEVYLHGFFD